MNHPALASSAPTTEEDDDVGTCSICFVAFSAGEADHVPRLLKCGHSFCTGCLTRLLASSTPAPASAEAEQVTGALRCPKCRTVTRVLLGDGEAVAAGVKGLPRNFDLIDLLSSPALTHPRRTARAQSCGGCGQEAAAERFCEQCGAHLCVSCDAQLHALLLTRSHVRVASADAPEARAACEHHRAKKLEMWCETDGVAVCMVCLVAGPHKGHDAITIEEADERTREAARMELAHVEAAMGEIEVAVELQAEREAGEEESARKARAAIKRHFDRMREAVAQRERALGAEVDEWERTRAEAAAKRRAELAEIQTRLAAAGKALQQQQQQQQSGLGGSATSGNSAAACQAAMTAARGTQASSIGFASEDTWAQVVASSGRLAQRSHGCFLPAGAGVAASIRDYTALTAAQHTLEIRNPLGVAVDATTGHIVATVGSRRSQVHVLRADDGSRVRTLATTQLSGLGNPWGVAVDHATGHIVVTDYSHGRVLVWRADDGSFVRTFGSRGPDPGQFHSPCGVAVDKEGHIIVADANNHRVQVLHAEDGSCLHASGSRGIGPGQFQHPAGVAVDAATGNIIVADWDNHRVQVLRADGCFVRSFGSRGRGQGQFMRPVGVAVDKEGNVIVADTGNHRVQVWRADGSFLCSFGSPGGGPAQFKNPRGVAVDAATGHIIVADSGNHRIQVW